MASGRSLPQRLILDSSAVIGWSRGDARIRAVLRQALAWHLELRVPVVVLAETLRGGPHDAPVNRVLKAVGTAPTTPAIGRTLVSYAGEPAAATPPMLSSPPRHWQYRVPRF